ncbi:MAG TPA: histidine kinase [Bacteroidales bacterium]|nr:histidine kinase [Bacteroidales bacterium]HSA42478.1 histidine kinase [Bacteroidales bacterium]
MPRKTILLIHCCFWILFSLVPELPYIFPDRKYPLWLIHYNITTECLNFMNFYAVYFLITVNHFQRKEYLRIMSILFGIILIFSTLRVFGTRMVSHYISMMEELPGIRFVNVMVEIVNSLLFTTFGILMKFMIDWFSTQKLKAELLAQKQSSELALLRTQINPHFLFNTLNNLYSLVYKKSDVAPSVVMKLSEIMRYMLYDTNAEKVPLDKEINYLRSFIELQQLRIRVDNFIHLEIRGETSDRMIPPMLLIPFVENAFKHGKKDVPAPGISVMIDVDGDTMHFEIWNYCSMPNSSATDPYHGIGLKNVARRLQLMYPGAHELSVAPCGEKFLVKLNIRSL